MKFSLILFLIGILGFVLNKKNIILMPISIEVMLLSITFLILLSSLSFDDILGQTFSVYIIALISKAVFFLFVSVLPLFYDLFVSSNIIAVSATYIGFKVLGTILLFLTPICLKAIIKLIVNSLDFLPKDFVNFINQKFTFFGLRCTIFSKIWLKQMLIFSSLKSLALCVVIILCTIFHMQFETFIFIYCFSLSVSYTGACSIITKNKNWGFIFCMFIYTFFIICISKYVFFSVLLYIS